MEQYPYQPPQPPVVQQPPVYPQPAPYYGQPPYGLYGPQTQYPVQVVYAPPPFAVGQKRDPRRTEAARTLNIMCLLVLLETAAALVFEIPLLLVFERLGVDIYESGVAFQLLTAAMVPLSTALPFFVYMLMRHRHAAEYLRFDKVGFFPGLLCVLAGLALCLLGNLPANLIKDVLEPFGYQPMEGPAFGDSWPMFILEFLSTAVLVPVMEEFAFRGVLFSALKKHGRGFAIVASALVFSLAHMDFSNVVFAFIAGLVFGWLYDRTGNLWIGVAIHALNNGLAVVGGYEDFLFGSLADTADVLLTGIPIAVGLVALLLLLIIPKCRRLVFKRRPGEEGVPAPLKAGESGGAMARSPLLWVLVGAAALYTVTLFL